MIAIMVVKLPTPEEYNVNPDMTAREETELMALDWKSSENTSLELRVASEQVQRALARQHDSTTYKELLANIYVNHAGLSMAQGRILKRINRYIVLTFLIQLFVIIFVLLKL
jgi:hypothetical protein